MPLQPRLRRWWYVACFSAELKPGATVATKILDTPIVLFRGANGSVGAFLDRCPHRSVPLSFGKVVGNELQCGYHGWRFDPEGTCTAIPGLAGEIGSNKARCARAFPIREQQGVIWVCPSTDGEPDSEPFRFRCADDPGYTTVRRNLHARGSLFGMIENALDVPHTAFLHAGLFRRDEARRPIRCVVQRFSDRVEAEYIGESRPSGIAGRILSPSGGEVTHFDRFHLPSIVEVEYRIGDENHILLNGACTPISDWETRMFAVVSVRSRMPIWLVRPIVQPIALRIFGQDTEVLELQTRTVEQFGDEAYVSTEIDLLGPHILRLMRRAEKGDLGDGDSQPYRKEVTMLV